MFARSGEFELSDVLATFGANVAPRCFVVCIPAAEGGTVWSSPELESEFRLDAVLSGADDEYGKDDRRNAIVITKSVFDEAETDARQAAALDSIRARVLERTLNSQDEDHHYLVGTPRAIASHLCFPVARVVRSLWDGYAALNSEQLGNGIRSWRSPQHGLVARVIGNISDALRTPKVPYLRWPNGRDRRDLIDQTAQSFIDRLVAVHGDWDGNSLYEAMNLLAAQPYEGRSSSGSIVLAGAGADLDVAIQFRPPIELATPRSFRKVLEMTDGQLAALTDGVAIFGLGSIAETYDAARETIFRLSVPARGVWEISHASEVLMRVENGTAHLPVEPMPKDRFIDAVDRLFGGTSDPEYLWDLAQAAVAQSHGTMLVVHRNAASESTRLAGQATTIVPTKLRPGTLTSAASIDGAIVVDPSGMCYAVGVILDGLSVPDLGDPARGARYNSALRYLHTAGGDALIVIVSEDGMISLFPNLNRRVSRKSVADAVEWLESAAVTTDRAAFFRRVRHVDALSFYLNEAQCARANAARSRFEEMSRERHPSAIHLVDIPQYSVNSAMNDSYFID